MRRITVILPNYNHARYLPRRVESILSQTAGDFELLILDDKSPDDSREVIARYQGDPRVRTVFNEKNSGAAYLQWRLGLSLSQSEYVWIAESDDYADPSLLEKLVKALDENPTAGLAVANSLLVDENDQPLGNYLDVQQRDPRYVDYDFSCWDRDFAMAGREYCARYLFPWNTIPNASAVVFRRSALETAGGPVVDMKICGDWMTYINVLMNHDIVRIADVLNYFRQHKSNVRSKTRPVDFVRESRLVQEATASALGLSRNPLRGRVVINYYVQAIMTKERRPPHNKVPLARAISVLRDSAGFGPRVLASAAQTLAKEGAADVARRLGILKRKPETA